MIVKITRAVAFSIMTLTSTGALAGTGALEICEIFAERFQKILPFQADEVTKLTNVGCFSHNGKTTLVYRANIEFSPKVLSELGLAGLSQSELLAHFDMSPLKSYAVNQWCKEDPNKTLLIKFFDVNYGYYTLDGSLVGQMRLTNDDCRR